VAEKNIGCRQSCMPAQIDLHRWRKPSQWHNLPMPDYECRLGKIILCGDRLEYVVRQPGIQQYHCSRIAAEHSARKGINLVKR